MPGCKIYSIHACVWLLVLSVSLSLVFQPPVCNQCPAGSQGGFLLPSLCPWSCCFDTEALLSARDSTLELPGLPSSHNFILGKFLSFPGDKTWATFALTWIISEGIQPCFVMKVTQGGWWGMRIPSDGNSWEVSESRCLHLLCCRIVLISFLVYAEKYIWQAGRWETPAEQIITLKDWLSLPFPQLSPKGKKKKEERKKIQAPALYIQHLSNCHRSLLL